MRILRARTVVTMDGPPIANGAVAVAGEAIVEVGLYDDIRRNHLGEVVDLGERVLLPGLINAHCHLDYTCLRGKIPPQKSFPAWIKAINAAKATLSADDYVQSINAGFAEAQRFGTTSLVNLTAFPELIGLVRPALRTCWAAELIDVRAPDKAGELLEKTRAQLQSTGHPWLAPHAPYTASRNLYRLCQGPGWPLTTHLAESREEMQMFRDGSGELYEFIRSINPSFEAPGQTPVAYFLRALDQGGSWLLAHLNELDETDYALLDERRSLGVVHCPRSHAYFGHAPFPFERLRELGLPISLGTDSLASNRDLNLFEEMRTFHAAFPRTNPEEVLRMVTTNTGLPRVGRLATGYHADIIAITNSSASNDIYEEIINSRQQPWVMIAGQAGTL